VWMNEGRKASRKTGAMGRRQSEGPAHPNTVASHRERRGMECCPLHQQNTGKIQPMPHAPPCPCFKFFLAQYLYRLCSLRFQGVRDFHRTTKLFHVVPCIQTRTLFCQQNTHTCTSLADIFSRNYLPERLRTMQELATRPQPRSCSFVAILLTIRCCWLRLLAVQRSAS
jgi:hypothetical protein